jgi:hypothetical protein
LTTSGGPRDEFFLVWKKCRLCVEFRDHRSCADDEAQVLLSEASGTVNTGDVVDADFTAPTGIVI